MSDEATLTRVSQNSRKTYEEGNSITTTQGLSQVDNSWADFGHAEPRGFLGSSIYKSLNSVPKDLEVALLFLAEDRSRYV